jgi:hypothetical protein
MAIAALIGNAARICVWWRDVDWRAAGAFAITAAPGAAFGAQTLIALNEYWVEIGLGIFLIIVVPLRRAMSRAGRTVTLAGLAIAGAPLGFLTGLVASTGPINAPLFLAYGLTRGSYSECISNSRGPAARSGVARSRYRRHTHCWRTVRQTTRVAHTPSKIWGADGYSSNRFGNRVNMECFHRIRTNFDRNSKQHLQPKGSPLLTEPTPFKKRTPCYRHLHYIDCGVGRQSYGT